MDSILEEFKGGWNKSKIDPREVGSKGRWIQSVMDPLFDRNKT